MRVEYDLSAEDLLHFQKYHWKHSPVMQRQYRMGFIVSPVLGAALATFLVGAKQPAHWLVVFLTTAGVGAALYAWLCRRSLHSNLSAALAEGKNLGTLGRHTVELKPEGLHEVTEVNETLHKWRGIERVEADARYLFVYTQAVMAHVIPRRAFAAPEDAERFLALARELQGTAAA